MSIGSENRARRAKRLQIGSADDFDPLPSIEGLKNAAVSGLSALQSAGSAGYAGIRASMGAVARDERSLSDRIKQDVSSPDALLNPVQTAVKVLIGEPVTKALQKSGIAGAIEKKYTQAEKGLDKMSEETKKSPSYKPELNTIRNENGELDLKKLKNIDVVLGNVSQALGSMAPTIGAAIATGGLGAGVVAGTMEKGSAQQEFERSLSKQRGVPVEELSDEDKNLVNAASTTYGMVSGVLESLLPAKFAKDVFGKKLQETLLKRIFLNAPKEAVTSFVLEGSTEGMQRYAQNVIGRLTAIEKDKPLTDGVIDEAIAGGLTGGALGIVQGVSSGQEPVTVAPVAPPKEEEKPATTIPAASVETTPAVDRAEVNKTIEKMSRLAPSSVEVFAKAIDGEMTVEDVGQLNEKEKTVLGIALSQAKEAGVADPVQLEENIQLIESAGIKIPNREPVKEVAPVKTEKKEVVVPEKPVVKEKPVVEPKKEVVVTPEKKEVSKTKYVPQVFDGKDIAKEAKELGSDQGGLSDFTLDEIKSEDYINETVSIADLRKSDKDLDEYLKNTEEVREYEGADFDMRPIVSSKGEVRDGYNRIHQMIVNGETEIEILKGKVREEKKKSSPRVEAARAKNKIKAKATAESDRKKAIKQAADRKAAAEKEAKKEKAAKFGAALRAEKDRKNTQPEAEVKKAVASIKNSLVKEKPAEDVVKKALDARKKDLTERGWLKEDKPKGKTKSTYKLRFKSIKDADEEDLDNFRSPSVVAKFIEGKKVTKSDYRKDGIYIGKKELKVFIDNSKEFQENPVFTMKSGNLVFEGKNQYFSIIPKAIGVRGIKEGETLEIVPEELKSKKEMPILARFSLKDRYLRDDQGKFVSPKAIDKMGKKEVADFLTIDKAYQIAAKVMAETEPTLRSVMQMQIAEEMLVNGTGGTQFYKDGYYMSQKGLIMAAVNGQSEKEYEGVLRHEINHLAFAMLPREKQVLIEEWFKKLSRDEVAVIFESPATAYEYELKSKKAVEWSVDAQDFVKQSPLTFMADETFNRYMNQVDRARAEQNKLYTMMMDMVKAIFRLIDRINQEIFKKESQAAKRRKTLDLYRNVFRSYKTGDFVIPIGYLRAIRQNGFEKGSIDIADSEGSGAFSLRAIEGGLNKVLSDGEKQKVQKIQDIYEKAWEQVYGTKPPKSLSGMIGPGKDFNARNLDMYLAPSQYGLGRKNVALVNEAVRIATKTSKAEQRAEDLRVYTKAKEKLVDSYKKKASDIEAIKKVAVDYVKATLPKERRGEYLDAVRKVKTVKQLRRIMDSVDKKRDAFERKQLIRAIQKVAENIDKLPVDFQRSIIAITSEIELKKHTKRLINKLKNTKEWLETQANDLGMPRRVLNQLGILERTPYEQVTIEQLTAIKNQFLIYDTVGRNILKERAVTKARTKSQLIDEVVENITNLDTISPDKKKNPTLEETITRMELSKEALSQIDTGFLGMDRIFSMMDGGKRYAGAMYTTFKEGIDVLWNDWQKNVDPKLQTFWKMVNDLGMTQKNAERIAMYAYKVQRGGQDKLVEDNKYTKKELEELVLTDKEMAVYNWMRRELDAIHPVLSKYLADSGNENLGFQVDYFPMMTNYGATKPVIEEVIGDHRMTRDVFGNVKERKDNAHQPLKMDAFQVFDSYLLKATHLIYLDSKISELSGIARSDKFRTAAGDKAQTIVLNWLDVMARMGGVANDNTPRGDLIPNSEKLIGVKTDLSTLRNNMSPLILGFRVNTVVLQPTAIFDGAAEIGMGYIAGGITKSFDKRWREFTRSASSELRNRSGGDQAFQELSDNSTLKKIQLMSLSGIKVTDGYTASATWLGAYQKKMDELGLPMTLDSTNKEATLYANLIVRLTQSSGNYKDLPPVMVGQNRFFWKVLFTFQSFVMNRWSSIRYDIPYKIKNDKQAAAIHIAYLTTSYAVSSGLSVAVYSMMHPNSDDGEDFLDKWFAATWASMLQTVPIVGQLFSSVKYQSTPSALIEITNKITEAIRAAGVSKNTETKMKHILRVLTYSGGLIWGLPADQFRQIVEEFVLAKEKNSSF